MRHSQRLAFLDPLLKERNNRAVTAQHVSETHCHKLRPDIGEYALFPVLVYNFNAFVREENPGPSSMT